MNAEIKSDDGRPELESPVFTVCTLNVGGRNTNSFEFEMRGDLTELGEAWGERYQQANSCLSESGPSTVQGLEKAVDAAYAQMASEPRSTESVVTSLLNDDTWEKALERVTRSSAFSHVSSFNNDVTTLSVERGSDAICAYAASTAFSRPWTVDGPDSLRQEFACW